MPNTCEIERCLADVERTPRRCLGEVLTVTADAARPRHRAGHAVPDHIGRPDRGLWDL